MTKASPILITKIHPLDHMPEADKAVVRRFLFDGVRGLDEKHDRRWKRFWSRIWNSEPGEVFQLVNVIERNAPFHRRHRAILERLFASQERFRNIDALHDWMKIGAYWVTWEEGKSGKPIPKPRSTSFEVCSDDQMREAHAAMVDFLHTERAQRFLWRNLKPAMRAEMLESTLKDPNEREQAA